MFRIYKALKGNAPFPPLWAIIVMTSFGGEGLQAKKDTLPKAYFTQQKRLNGGDWWHQVGGMGELKEPELQGTCIADFTLCSGTRKASREFSKEWELERKIF